MKRVRLTNERVNSYGFRVLTGGIDLEQYRKNPVLLYMHERGNVIGYVKDLRVEGGEISGELVFDEASELSVRCKKQFEGGSLKMVSIGIVIKETSDRKDLLLEGQTRPTVTKSRLVEVSLVDIGANDDAIVMKAEGERVLLYGLKDQKDCDELLQQLNNNPIKQEEMELKALALKLGLPETATEQEVMDKIAGLQSAQEELVTLRTENETLKKAGIVTLVDGAIAGKKITADKKDHFVQLGLQVGAETLKATLDAMAVQVKPSDLLHLGAGGGSAEWKKLSEVPAEKIAELKEKDPETYKRLYQAEYGMDL